MIPLSSDTGPGGIGRTKDQGAAVSGNTTVYAFNFMKGSPAVWTYNAIRFNSGGTALSRPTGTAPVTLQQSTAHPDAAARRWHLETMTGGQYRIRNGNPGTGTECACRIAGTTDVRVTTCADNTNCRWTRIADAPRGSVFKLRNVENGRCIDRLDAGDTTSNLAFRTCESGYSSKQSLFLDKYSWPP
jgi:hypothetical protein